MNEKEYLMLREEILHLDTLVNNTINFFYVFIASFLAFSLIQDDTIFLLLSYIVILPAYLIVINKSQGMLKIGAYLCVFYEEKSFNFKWESRNVQFNKLGSKPNFSYLRSFSLPFVLVSAVTTILIIYRTGVNANFQLYEIVKAIVALLSFALIMAIALKTRRVTPDVYKRAWEKVQ